MEGYSSKCANLHCTSIYPNLPILFLCRRSAYRNCRFMQYYLKSFSFGRFFFCPSHAQQSLVKKHRGIKHWLHPLAQAQYRSVTGLVLLIRIHHRSFSNTLSLSSLSVDNSGTLATFSPLSESNVSGYGGTVDRASSSCRPTSVT